MYISIEGNIGSGKSTIAKALAQKLKATFLPEQFEDNALLPLFYTNHKKYAFATEYSFLIDRHKQLTNFFKVNQKDKTIVSDFDFDKCLCFAKTNLSKKDFKFYKKHFSAIKKTLPSPDLVVYLDTTTDQLMNNVKKRGRVLEKNLEQNYLDDLKKSLDKYYKKDGDINGLVLILTINEYGNETINNSCEQIIDIINTRIK